MTLPDCMMPDGADPCKGYAELRAEIEQLKAEPLYQTLDELRKERIVTATFLDRLADELDRHGPALEDDAAECREWAEKLRK